MIEKAKSPSGRFKSSNWKKIVVKDFRRNKFLYLMILPVILYYLLFCYVPMIGVQIAFKDFKPMLGIWDSPITDNFGMKHFIEFFTNPFFSRILKNTMLISLISIIFSFPAPIILALVLNEIRFKKLKRVVQTVSYMPHFISLVVVCGMVRHFCLSDGLFNQLFNLLGISTTNSWLQIPEAFRTIYVGSDIWQSVGWNSIIYLAAIAGVDYQLYEAAEIDGAGRWQKLIHITFPTIRPTVILLLIMQVGKTMNVGYEKVLLLYNSTIYETADVISTYVYRKGLLDFDYSYSTAVNLFNSVINFILVIIANKISSKLSETSLF
ncbi:MAG: ABC transporter permease [Acetatifactor sp.]